MLFDDRFGGPPKRVYQVAQGLNAKGIATVCCYPQGDGNAPGLAQPYGVAARRLDFERIPPLRKPLRVLGWLARLPRDIGRFRAFYRRERPDVVHVNGAVFIAAGIAARLERYPLLWHLNDVSVPWPLCRALGWVVRRCATRVAASVHAVASHYGVREGRYSLLYAPVDVTRFSPRSPIASANASGRKLRIGTIANWNRGKGITDFVEVAAILKRSMGDRVEFVVAGARLATQRDYAARVDAAIAAHGLEACMHELGFVEDVAPVVATLDIVVLCSYAEAGPMVLMEAMAGGLPVVAYAAGGVRELVDAIPGCPAGYVVPIGDVGAVAQRVQQLCGDPEARSRMGAAGRAAVEARFTLERAIVAHEQIYFSLVGRSARTAEQQ